MQGSSRRAASGTADDPSPSSVEERLHAIWQRSVDHRETLPGEHALASELGVSRPQLREHLVRLERDGLIRRRQGADTVVNVAASDIDVRFDLQIDYANMLRERGHEVSVEVLSAVRRPLSASEVEFFDVPTGWMALQIVKRWRADGEILVRADDVLAVPATVTLAQIDLAAEIASLAKQFRGTQVEWTIAVPGAVALDESERADLEQPPGSIALSIEAIGVGQKGQRVFQARELHISGRVRFGFIRSRSQGPGA